MERQNHNGISMFLSPCPIMVPMGGKKVSERACVVIQVPRQRGPARVNRMEPH